MFHDDATKEGGAVFWDNKRPQRPLDNLCSTFEETEREIAREKEAKEIKILTKNPDGARIRVSRLPWKQ